VLGRLQRVFDGTGRIERHGDIDDYRWVAEGVPAVKVVLSSIGTWLGPVKREQAALALDRFAAQIRLKGDATRCVRGHAYTYIAMKAGRRRRVCNACDRLLERRKRAALGIPPRQFKNEARRYTS
jgi:hypothetical protein